MTVNAPTKETAMDLGKRLLVWLGSLAALWMLAILVYTAIALRAGVHEEMEGAHAVVELLATAAAANLGDAASQIELQSLLASGSSRHLVARWADEPVVNAAEQPALLHRLARSLTATGEPLPSHRIAIGPRTLVIEPAPDSEIDEVLGDVLPLLLLLLAAGIVMLVGVGWIVRQALAPAGVLCAGLARLQAGQPEPAFPALQLREYAAIARGIERLAASLAQARDAQSRLAQRLIDVQERERRELAHDLHDEFGQHLTAMSASAALLQRHAEQLDPRRVAQAAAQLADSLRAIQGQLRELLGRLRPHGLDAASLPQELGVLVERARASHAGVQVRAAIEPSLPALGDDAALALYRSLQEALTNAFRHSGAHALEVQLDVPTPQRVRLRVRDDGGGGGRAAALVGGTPSHGLGLLGMRERLAMVGGGVQVRDNPGPGLCVEVWVPTLDARAAAAQSLIPGGAFDQRLAA